MLKNCRDNIVALTRRNIVAKSRQQTNTMAELCTGIQKVAGSILGDPFKFIQGCVASTRCQLLRSEKFVASPEMTINEASC